MTWEDTVIYQFLSWFFDKFREHTDGLHTLIIGSAAVIIVGIVAVIMYNLYLWKGWLVFPALIVLWMVIELINGVGLYLKHR